MVYRVYVEKKPQFAHEAKGLENDIIKILQIKGLKSLRVVNRYDVENIDKDLFDYSKNTVFSEPQVDITADSLDFDGKIVFGVEFLPGQFAQ